MSGSDCVSFDQTQSQICSICSICSICYGGFSDGNKRTAWIAIRRFLEVNGAKINYTSTGAIFLMLGVADGTISEKQIASWLRDRAC